ncbi:MAG: ATP-binding protein, partial [Angustibacter sp.]
SDIAMAPRALDLNEYVRLAARSGFPEAAVKLSPRAADTWLAAYLDHAVARDLNSAQENRDPLRLARYLEALALSTAGLPSDSTLMATADLSRAAAKAYDELLMRLYLLDLLPAWHTNRLSRLVKRPKRYLIDPGLAMRAARLSELSVLRDGDLLGRIIDTFVVAQIRPEAAHFWPDIRLYHLRDETGRHEVDLILDLGGNDIIAIEIKATAAPTMHDARHLHWLREKLGANFIRGVVFHSGPMPFPLGDRIWALPISSLWAEH